MSTLIYNENHTRIIQYGAKELVLGNRTGGDSNRYYLNEFFLQRPALNTVLTTDFDNADATNASNTTIRTAEKVANRNFELLGTNMTTALCTFEYNTGRVGILLTTAGAEDDQAIVLPHLDNGGDKGTSQSAWNSTLWGTENQVVWECAIITKITADSITNTSFWAGLKKTDTGVFATDTNQAYFLYSSNDEMGTLTTNDNLHFIYSIAGSNYITDLGIAVAQNTIYRLRIEIDVNRQASVYVNEVLYGLNITTTLATQSDTGIKSLALTNDEDLIPYVGLQAHAGAAKTLTLCYEKISRLLFE